MATAAYRETARIIRAYFRGRAQEDRRQLVAARKVARMEIRKAQRAASACLCGETTRDRLLPDNTHTGWICVWCLQHHQDGAAHGLA